MRKFLSAKLHRATVTDANLDYEGSITIPKALLRESGILEFEAVSVWNISNGNRFDTYAISGPNASSSDQRAGICINGAAAHLTSPGDIVIIASFVMLTDEQIAEHRPRIILLDHNNCVI